MAVYRLTSARADDRVLMCLATWSVLPIDPYSLRPHEKAFIRRLNLALSGLIAIYAWLLLSFHGPR